MNQTLGLTIPPDVRLGIQLEGIFMPYARKQRDALYERQKRFVHYTSAEAALSIIKSKRLWMRNTTCMSDYREVQHGFEILRKFFSDKSKKDSFVQALDAHVPGVAMEAINLFDQWWEDTRLNTYISSISEHNDEEDSYGRLSMWRAFGGNTARVAIVFRIPFYSGGADKLNIMFSPVAYLGEDGVHAEIDSVIWNIRNNGDLIRSTERSRILSIVFNMLVAGVVCLKHKDFHEECEWRVIYAPNRASSPLVESSTEILGGIPQIVHKLPLDMKVSDALGELDLSRIFDRLIIGPSSFPWAMYQAFVDALEKCGVSEAHKLVFTSDIPIRS